MCTEIHDPCGDNVFQIRHTFLLAGPDGVFDRIEDHRGGHRGGDPPTEDPAGLDVDDVGDVGEP